MKQLKLSSFAIQILLDLLVNIFTYNTFFRLINQLNKIDSDIRIQKEIR